MVSGISTCWALVFRAAARPRSSRSMRRMLPIRVRFFSQPPGLNSRQSGLVAPVTSPQPSINQPPTAQSWCMLRARPSPARSYPPAFSFRFKSFLETSFDDPRSSRASDTDFRCTAYSVCANSQTFHFTDGRQAFQVPSGDDQITITAKGAGTPSARWLGESQN
jgi:hypothetical protein